MDKRALFVSAQPVEKEITSADGTAIAVHVCEVSDSDWMRYVATSASNDPDVQAGARAYLIAKGCVDTTGEPQFTHEEACRLKIAIARQLVALIVEHNLPNKDRKGNA